MSMDLQPHVFADRSPYLMRMGNPNDWTGDWRRQGRYLSRDEQHAAQQRLRENHAMIVGMAVRQIPSQTLAALMGVSRESVDRRLRPLGLKNAPGQVGRPAARRAA